MRRFLITLSLLFGLSGPAFAADEPRPMLTPEQRIEDAQLVADLMLTAAQVGSIIHDDAYCPHESTALCEGYRSNVYGIMITAYENAKYLVDRFKGIDTLNANQAGRYLNDRDGIRAEYLARLATLREVITDSGNTPVSLTAVE